MAWQSGWLYPLAIWYVFPMVGYHPHFCWSGIIYIISACVSNSAGESHARCRLAKFHVLCFNLRSCRWKKRISLVKSPYVWLTNYGSMHHISSEMEVSKKWRYPIPKSYIFIGYCMYIYICSLAFPKWYKPSILGSADIRWRQGAARLKRRSKDFKVKVPCELRGRLDHLPMVPLKKPWENPWENHGENIYGLDHWRLP